VLALIIVLSVPAPKVDGVVFGTPDPVSVIPAEKKKRIRPRAGTGGNVDDVAADRLMCWAVNDRVHIGVITGSGGISPLGLCGRHKKEQTQKKHHEENIKPFHFCQYPPCHIGGLPDIYPVEKSDESLLYWWVVFGQCTD